MRDSVFTEICKLPLTDGWLSGRVSYGVHWHPGVVLDYISTHTGRSLTECHVI